MDTMASSPNQPFIIDKILGRPLDPQQTLTQTNADGLPAIELSEEEKYLAEMPPKRQTLFRPVYVADNVPGGQYQDG